MAIALIIVALNKYQYTTVKKMRKFSIVILVFMVAMLGLIGGEVISSNQLATLSAEAATPSSSFGNIGPRANSGADPANGIYVSPDGHDSAATGSIDAPYQSINAALAAAQPGDTVILRGGTYREGFNVRIRKPNITIKSRNGEWAIIDLTTYQAGHDEDSGVYFDVDSSGSKLQAVEVKGGFYAVCTETRWDWGDPANRAGASNIIIEDCILHDSRNDVIKIKPNCDNITIRYNEIYNSGTAYGGGEGNAEGIDNVNGDNMVVQNNYIHDICSNAVYAKGGAIGVLIENNRIERAQEAGILVGFDTSPEYFDLSVNPQYYENIICMVRNNLIIDTGLSGIGLYAAKDAQIYNNTLVNVVNRGQYHSAIYFGVTFQDWESYAGRPASVNPDIHHNIISQPSGIVRPMIEIRYADELGGLSALDGNPVMSNNCYYIGGKNATFIDRRPGSALETASLAAWQSHINGDRGSLEIDPALNADYISTNPQCAGMGIGLDPSSSSTTSPTSTIAPSISNFKTINSYNNAMFTDVNENEWYGYHDQKGIANVYGYGLMQGNGKTFNPTGNMTIAEVITIAARVHHIYNGGTGELVQGSPWYQVYVDYAITNEIITAATFSDYRSAATRAEMAYIFARALPEAEFAAINMVNSLPDVSSNTPYHVAIFMLYRAGVLAGNDQMGTFHPDDNISRAEAAAIISRVILPATRISKDI